jgi:hypothetical protein
MATTINAWQVVNGKPTALTSSLADQHKETEVESWIFDGAPEILGDDIALIGRQVKAGGGTLDLIGIDGDGNVVIVELKRDKVPRDAVAQAIDYASDVASWNTEQLDEICREQRKKSLRDYLDERFGQEAPDEISIENIRILLVGFPRIGDERAERMVGWLSEQFDVPINMLVLGYLKSNSGDELLLRTATLPEGTDVEKATRTKSRKTIQTVSSIPGNYSDEDLQQHLSEYISNQTPVPTWFREVLLPAILEKPITRDELVKKLVDRGADQAKVGFQVTTISGALSRPQNDFLRQVVAYSNPNPWTKDDYRLREERYRSVVQSALDQARAIVHG